MPSQAERTIATRASIVDAARALFGQDGFFRVSLEDVARQVGVTKGAIYHHFGSKEGLFEAVLIEEQRRLLSLQATSPGEGHLLDRFAAAVRAYLLAVSAECTRQIVLADGPAVLGWERWRQLDDQMFGAAVRQAVALLTKADCSDERVDALASLLVGAVTEAAMKCASSSEPAVEAEKLSEALRVLLCALSR